MRERTTHSTVLLALFMGALLFCGMALAYVRSVQGDVPFAHSEISCLISFSVLISFWVVYFNWRPLRIASLRKFLDENTYRLSFEEPNPNPPPDYTQTNEALRQRANANIVSQGIFMTVISMLVGPIVSHTGSLTRFQSDLQHVILIPAMLTIALLLWSIDLLDTAQNVFRGEDVNKLELMVHFFRGIGKHGAASLRFYGFASLSIFLFMAMGFFATKYAPIGVGVFVYFGYPILFGYTGTIKYGDVIDIKIDRDCTFPMRCIMITFIALSLFAFF